MNDVSVLVPYVVSGLVIAGGILALLSFWGRSAGFSTSERIVSLGLSVAAFVTAATWLVP